MAGLQEEKRLENCWLGFMLVWPAALLELVAKDRWIPGLLFGRLVLAPRAALDPFQNGRSLHLHTIFLCLQ